MRNKIIAFAAFVELIGIPAFAAEMPLKAPPPPPAPVNSWTGFYVGANIGGGWGNGSVAYSPNDPASAVLFGFSTPPPVSFATSGGLGGLQFGYNYQFNQSWLVGLEADFDRSQINGFGTSGGSLTGIPIQATVNQTVNWFGTVRPRLGFLPTDKFLLYVTGGLAYGETNRNGNYNNSTSGTNFSVGAPSFSFSCNPNSTCFAGTSNSWAVGGTIGGGFEYAFWNNLRFKVEYLYVSLNGKLVTEPTFLFTPGTTPSSFNANFSRNEFNVVRGGLNYQF